MELKLEKEEHKPEVGDVIRFEMSSNLGSHDITEDSWLVIANSSGQKYSFLCLNTMSIATSKTFEFEENVVNTIRSEVDTMYGASVRIIEIIKKSDLILTRK